MPVEIKEPSIDLRSIERAILLEAAGTLGEDYKAAMYGQNIEVCLHINALTKKLLGIYGVAIGNDPARDAQLGLGSAPDFNGERDKINARFDRGEIGKEMRNAQLRDVDKDEQRHIRLQSEFDAQAWQIVKKWDNILRKRAMALTKVWQDGQEVELIELNIEGFVPDEVKAAAPESAEVPWEDTVRITPAGLNFLASNKRLRPRRLSITDRLLRRKTISSDPLDQELEVYS